MNRKRTQKSRRSSAACSDKRIRGGKKSKKRRGKPVTQQATQRFSHGHPLLHFLLIFAVLLGVFYIFIAFSQVYNRRFLPSYHHLIARASGFLLALLEHDITVVGVVISSPSFSVEIVRGCDAIEPIALYVFAVLAFPSQFKKKLPGMIMGIVLLLILNLIRIVSLFLIGVCFPKIFALTHMDVWQALFIFSAVLFWVVWLLWATRSQVVTWPSSS